jgi:hypothetical protein
MAVQLYANNAIGTLDAGIDNDDTSVVLSSGDGARFPSPTNGDWFLATLPERVGVHEVSWEIVKCTARSGDTLTVVRGQEGTTAQAWDAANVIELRWTAGSKIDSANVINTPAGNVVATTVQGAINELDGEKQGAHADLTALSGLSTTGLIKRTGTGTAAIVTVTAAGEAILDDATAADQRATLGAQATITGAATTIASSNLATSMALVSDADGKVAAHSTVSATELGYLDGVTSAIQGQVDAKAPLTDPQFTQYIGVGTAASSSYPINISKASGSGEGRTMIFATNPSTGVGSMTAIKLLAGSSTAPFVIHRWASEYTGITPCQNRGGFTITDGLAGAAFVFGNIAQTIDLVYNATVYGRITAGGAYIIGSGTDDASGAMVQVTGNVNVHSGYAYYLNNVKVLGARITGWGAPTGTASRATFDTSTVTHATLSQVVKALIDDLRTHGVIGN